MSFAYKPLAPSLRAGPQWAKAVLWCMAWCFCFIAPANAQILSFEKLDGIPQNIKVINALEMDQDSIIWIGTNRGLIRMEGDSIKTIYDKNQPFRYTINTLHIDRQNRLWLGTFTSSIVRYEDQQHVKEISLLEYTDNNYELISSIAVYKDEVWISTSNGRLFTYNQTTEEIQVKKPPRCKSIYDVKIHHKNGDIWLATSSGMYEDGFLRRWKQNKYFNIAYGIYKNGDEYWAVGRRSNNKIALIYHLNFFLTVMGFDIPQYQWRDMILEGLGDPYTKFNDVAFDPTGNIWFATNDGIIRYNPEVGYGLPIRQDKYNSFNMQEVRNILVENKNRIWVTSYGNTVYLINFRK